MRYKIEFFSRSVSPISKMDARVCLTGKKTDDFDQYLKAKIKDAVAIHYFVGGWI